MGNPYNLTEITRLARKHNLWLVEDCCDALGSTYNGRLFSVIEEAVLNEPPYPEPDQLVVVDQLFRPAGEEMRPSQWSYPRYVAFTEEATAFSALGAYAARTMTLTELGAPLDHHICVKEGEIEVRIRAGIDLLPRARAAFMAAAGLATVGIALAALVPNVQPEPGDGPAPGH